MNIWSSLSGELEAELLTADLLGSLRAIAQEGISLSRVLPAGELSISFRLRRGDYRKLRRLCRRRGEKLTLRHRLGIYWHLKALGKRPVLVVGLALFLATALWLPTRVFFFRVEGNERLSQGEILAAAENCGMTFGSSREKIRSEKIKNRLLSQLPELKWAGINTHGCVAVIRVAEKPERSAMEPGNTGICHIVASRDGLVTALTATAGTPLCSPGQGVVKGQVLISGLTDCGIAVKAQAAQGEVTALTTRTIRAVTPENQALRGASQKKIIRRSLILGKKRIKLWIGSGIWDAECGRMYREYPLILPGGFRLPVALAEDTLTVYPLQETSVSEEAANAQLQAYADQALSQEMLGGSVRRRKESLTLDQGVYFLEGSYSCQEVISRPKWEQIGDTYE